MKNIALAIFCTFFLTLPTESISQPLYVIDSLNPVYTNLNDHLYVLKEEKGITDGESIRSPLIDSLFKPYSISLLDDPHSAYWGKFRILNDLSETGVLQDWVLTIGQGSLIDVFVYSQKGSLLYKETTGQLVPASKKRLKTGLRRERIFFSLPFGDTVSVFIRLQVISGQQPHFDLHLAVEDYVKSPSYSQKRHNDGLFMGFMLTMILINLLFYYPTQDRAFLYQVMFLLGITLFMTHPTNMICDAPFFREHPKFIEPALYVFVVIANIAYMLFLRVYLNLADLLPRWDRFFKWLISANILIGGISIVYYSLTLNEVISGKIMTVLIVIQYAPLLFLMYDLYKTRDHKVYFMLAATTVLITGAIVLAIGVILGYGVSLSLAQFFLAGNILLFFLGLAYRMKALRTEEQNAQKLKDLNEIKTRLYTNITHEFRTPLTVIQGMAKEISKIPLLEHDKSAMKALQLIRSNGDNMLELVNRLLEMAKLESGNTELNLSKGDIIAFVSFLVSTFKQFTQTKNIELRFFSEVLSLETNFDNQKLQQIVTNLVANAIKFTPAGGLINVTIRKVEVKKAEQLEIEIADNGEGIAKTELTKIFDRFYQGESSRLKGQGTGIGLALTKELVTILGGTIDVHSLFRKGSTFTVRFPLIPLSEEALDAGEIGVTPPSTAEERCVLSHLDEDPEHGFGFNDELPLILIIEDNPDILYYLRKLLQHKYEVETAVNGKEGVEIAIETIPDIIISDVMMPEMDGFEVCERLKNDERTNHIPIILLTAKVSDKDRISGLEHGADIYLNKPFLQEELFAHLNNLVELRKHLQVRFTKSLSGEYFGNTTAEIDDPFLQKLQQLILAKLKDFSFGIPEVCKAMNTSRAQLHRKVKALTNKSISHFIRHVKLQKSKKLLLNSNLSISEVAYSSGFSNHSYFTKLFAEEFKISPSSFRSNKGE